MPTGKLTIRGIKAIKAPSSGYTVTWDQELPGFGLRTTAAGVKSFVLAYRNSARRSRNLTIGRFGVLTLAQARRRARELLVQVAAGRDPVAEKESSKGLTVAELAERYLEQHARSKKKPSSVKADEVNLKNHVLPNLGRLRVDAVSREDVGALHHKLRKTSGAANRVLALVSKMMNLSEKWGLRPDGTNPCRHVERFKERRRQRYLSESEIGRLGAALIQLEQEAGQDVKTEKLRARRIREARSLAAAVRLLILTGARRSEIVGLRWDWVDFERGYLRLPDSKSDAKLIDLNAPALAVLESLDRCSEYVIPGRNCDAPLVGFSKAWARVAKMAKLEDLRAHDLRHSFASVGAAGGYSLVTIGALLGHSQPATTARYAHLANSPARAASEAIGGRIAAALSGKPDAEVIELRPGVK